MSCPRFMFHNFIIFDTLIKLTAFNTTRLADPVDKLKAVAYKRTASNSPVWDRGRELSKFIQNTNLELWLHTNREPIHWGESVNYTQQTNLRKRIFCSYPSHFVAGSSHFHYIRCRTPGQQYCAIEMISTGFSVFFIFRCTQFQWLLCLRRLFAALACANVALYVSLRSLM